MFLTAGICAALVSVGRTGVGVVVDTSLLNGAVWTLGPDMAYSSITGTEPPHPASDARDLPPLVGQHRTADGRWLSLSMLDADRYWAPTCRALGLGALADEFSDAASRDGAREHLVAQLGTAIAQRTADQLDAALRAEGCIFSFYAAPHQVLADGAVSANAYAPPHPDHPTLRLAAAPAQFDDELPVHRRGAPRQGEHTEEILADVGYTTDEIATLIATGVARRDESPPGGAHSPG
jgi:crotonobetainyl-CoA:carnitine CoA-transferase CaiB-like acyl-CoA transferase